MLRVATHYRLHAGEAQRENVLIGRDCSLQVPQLWADRFPDICTARDGFFSGAVARGTLCPMTQQSRIIKCLILFQIPRYRKG